MLYHHAQPLYVCLGSFSDSLGVDRIRVYRKRITGACDIRIVWMKIDFGVPFLCNGQPFCYKSFRKFCYQLCIQGHVFTAHITGSGTIPRGHLTGNGSLSHNEHVRQEHLNSVSKSLSRFELDLR